MAVSREEVIQIAALARLRLTEEEVDQFADQLNSVLGHVEELTALDVSSVPMVGGVSEKGIARRSEELGPDLLHLSPSAFAPAWEDGFFSLPRLAALDQSELDEGFADKASLESAGRPDEASVTGEVG